MKKIAAILLLGIFVFNMFGYKIWLSYMEDKDNSTLQAALDNGQFQGEELITVKTPINLPYYNNTKEFSRMDGEVEINGMYYKYVKGRIYNDSLELVCLPNPQKTKMVQAKDDFFKATADIQKKSSEKNKSNSSNTLKKMLSEFVSGEARETYLENTIITLSYLSEYNTNLGMLHKSTVEQPPDITSNFC
jgi:hypothetical protein